MLNKSNSQLHVFFLGQLKNLTKKAINTFNARVQVDMIITFILFFFLKKKLKGF